MNSEFPHRWLDWPTDAKVQYLTNTRSRVELFEEVADAAGVELDREVTSKNARFRKDELARIALRLGSYRD